MHAYFWCHGRDCRLSRRRELTLVPAPGMPLGTARYAVTEKLEDVESQSANSESFGHSPPAAEQANSPVAEFVNDCGKNDPSFEMVANGAGARAPVPRGGADAGGSGAHSAATEEPDRQPVLCGCRGSRRVAPDAAPAAAPRKQVRVIAPGTAPSRDGTSWQTTDGGTREFLAGAPAAERRRLSFDENKPADDSGKGPSWQKDGSGSRTFVPRDAAEPAAAPPPKDCAIL
jgi:hypothetical protein